MQAYSFPQVLDAIGALGEEGSAAAGLKFFRLTGASVNRGVSAFCAVNLYGASGVPVVGAQVVNLRPDGKGEIGVTDASGKTQFNYAAASAFSNRGEGPFTVFVAGGAQKDEDSKLVSWQAKMSDTVKSLGDFQGTHTEIYLQFVEQTAGAPPGGGGPGGTTARLQFDGLIAAFEQVIAELKKLNG